MQPVRLRASEPPW